jgi:ATP-dependent Clp protease protease subunit
VLLVIFKILDAQLLSEKYNTKLFDLLGDYCGKSREQVLEDANRDLWLDAEEAKAYGIIDGVITKRK